VINISWLLIFLTTPAMILILPIIMILIAVLCY